MERDDYFGNKTPLVVLWLLTMTKHNSRYKLIEKSIYKIKIINDA